MQHKYFYFNDFHEYAMVALVALSWLLKEFLLDLISRDVVTEYINKRIFIYMSKTMVWNWTAPCENKIFLIFWLHHFLTINLKVAILSAS